MESFTHKIVSVVCSYHNRQGVCPKAPLAYPTTSCSSKAGCAAAAAATHGKVNKD